MSRTVSDMPKMTDYVRAGFDRRRRPWDRAELPEWWDLVVWAGLAALIGMLLLNAMFGRDGSSGTAIGDDAGFAVKTLNPHTFTPAPAPSGDGPASSAGTPGGDDFTATAAVRTPMTGGGTAVVPAGARNVALAAAEAAATGDWTGVPFAGAARPSPAPATPGGSVVGEPTVRDPAVTGTGQYQFSVTIRPGGAAPDRPVRITVERGPGGYAVRAP